MRRSRLRSVPPLPLATLGLLLAVPAGAQIPGSSFQALGDLPGGAVSSAANALSPDGAWVVGRSASASGTEAFRWSAGTGIEALGDLPGGGFSSDALAVVQGGGLVCGESDATEGRLAYSWHAGYGMIEQGYFDAAAPRSVMTDLDASGCVGVGWSRLGGYDVAALFSPCGGTAWWFPLEDVVDPTRAHAVSAFGDVAVGEVRVGGSWRACRWDHPYAGAVRIQLDAVGSPLDSSTALRCSTDGAVAVGFGVLAGRMVATRWDAGGLTLLADPGGSVQALRARGVSGTGERIVGLGIQGGTATAWIWDADAGVRALREVMEQDYGLALGGWTLFEAVDVSGDGQTIAGTGLDPQGHAGAWVAHLPIPCRADLTGDGVVDLADVGAFGRAYVEQTAAGDFNGDGTVNLADVGDFQAAWQAGC